MMTNIENFKSGVEHSMELLGSEPIQENLKQFFFDLQASQFIVPTNKPGESFATVAAEKEGSQQVLIPVFTCKEEFQKGLPEGYMSEIVSYYTLKHLIINDLKLGGLVINPFGKQLLISREQIAEIDGATTGMSLSKTVNAGKLSIAKVTEGCDRIAGAICEMVKCRPEVHRVYMVSATREGDKTPHLMLIFDFDGQEPQLFPEVAETIRPHLGNISNFELIKANIGLLRMVDVAEVRPIYIKRIVINN